MRLSAVDLACRRGGRDVFSGVSFNVGAGELLAVTGRNGAGKSSLLRIVAGLIRPVGGRLWLEGSDPELSIAEQVHYLGHQDPVKPSLSVLENLQFWAAFFAGVIKVYDALESVGLGAIATLPAGYLSAGQRRRLSIARLIAVKRPIWLLDEPTSTLDAAAQHRLAEFMRSHSCEAISTRAALFLRRRTARSGSATSKNCRSTAPFAPTPALMLPGWSNRLPPCHESAMSSP